MSPATPFRPTHWHFRFRLGPRPGSPRPLCSKMAVVGTPSRGRWQCRMGSTSRPGSFAPRPAHWPPGPRGPLGSGASVGAGGRAAMSELRDPPASLHPFSGPWLPRRSQCGLFACHLSPRPALSHQPLKSQRGADTWALSEEGARFTLEGGRRVPLGRRRVQARGRD